MKLFQLFIRFLLWLVYGFRAYNPAVLQTPGPVLLIPNHLTWIDWLFLLAHLDQDWRFVTSATTAQTTWLHRLIMVNSHTFPIDTASPYAVKRMAEYLQGGGRLVLFAEGRMSRTGALMKLYEGTGFLLFKTGAKVITAYLRGAERVRWARHYGWKAWFTPVSAHYSIVLTPPAFPELSTTQARTRLTRWLYDQMIDQQLRVEMEFGARTAPEAILAAAAQRPGFQVIQDFTRQTLNYRRLVVGAELLQRQWRNALGAEERIGVLLPNANALPATLLSLWLTGKVPAILNYTTGAATMLACAQLAGLKQVITSRTFIEKAKLKLHPLIEAGVQFIYLEDIRAQISDAARLLTLLHRLFNMPRFLPRMPRDAQAVAVILFTSGSEGAPKGVELTHANLLANVRQMLSVMAIQDDERFFTALPLFHSFGLTVGALLPLVRGVFLFLYPSPLHYRLVPEAFYDRECTLLLATNTFLNGYARKAHPYDFYNLRYLFAGAEKLQEATANFYARHYGVRVLEGYGATECSPVISVNTPLTPKFGSAGRLLPGLEYKLAPVEGVAEGGRLLVRGPNVMRGYLNPDANANFQALGGWYDTGDIVAVDDEGFIHILGRLKRFAKISGEMVSLTAVEEALAGAFPQYGLRCQAAILSRPDPDKGEMLIAVTNEPKLGLEEIRAVLKSKGLPNLWVPREIKFVREIPKLGTGKVNHRELQKLI
jgi:acyl-[acyl-carrier-protein]-phospholipid O-acyltransferase/long-chain-fatty-acid--[acyl-carrier-protein] ligase